MTVSRGQLTFVNINHLIAHILIAAEDTIALVRE
jgi:hypothetical protein